MLKTLDVLIGLSVVMLLVSMAVTVLTQCVLGLRNWRGKQLLSGIEGILVQIDPKLKDHATEIGKAVLTHPIIGPATGKLGGVIGRGELVRVLMELAGGQGAAPPSEPGGLNSLMLWLSGEGGPQALATAAKDALTKSLKDGGVDQPDKVLENVYAAALKLEGSNPELAAHIRHSMAIIQEAPGQFVARLNTWFDQTMDRVTESFTYNARQVTAVCALIVAVGLQLDTVDLLKKLSTDDELRKAIGRQAASVLADYDKKTAGAAKPPTSAEPPDVQQARVRLQEFGVTGYPLWPEKWECTWAKVPGVLLSAILLSLGAPFWYNALKNLINLRPLLAGKEDQQRTERATDQPAASPAGPAPPPAGEQGDLSAAG